MIKGTGGARKVRFAANEHGKRSGARVVYVDVVVDSQVYLLTAYPKNVKDNLTSDETKALANLIKTLKTR